MTLSFSTKWPERMGELAGQPNYFIDKIWNGIHRIKPECGVSCVNEIEYEQQYKNMFKGPWPKSVKSLPKLHTIRSGNRWKEGMKIHPVINNRTSWRFQFAPIMVCTGVQDIEIKHVKSSNSTPLIYIGIESVKTPGYMLCLDTYNPELKISPFGNIEKLAINDGFPSVEAFFAYFNGDFKGQLVHFTGLTY